MHYRQQDHISHLADSRAHALRALLPPVACRQRVLEPLADGGVLDGMHHVQSMVAIQAALHVHLHVLGQLAAGIERSSSSSSSM
jgi:hypothetical protein